MFCREARGTSRASSVQTAIRSAGVRLDQKEAFKEPAKQAEDSSPGRKPGGYQNEMDLSPEGRQKFRLEIVCRPLKRAKKTLGQVIPGLTPGATLFRHLRWLVGKLPGSGVAGADLLNRYRMLG